MLHPTERKSMILLKNSGKLFDVSFCKCANFSVCNCAKEKRVPQLKTNFLEDQRTDRKIFIGNIFFQ